MIPLFHQDQKRLQTSSVRVKLEVFAWNVSATPLRLHWRQYGWRDTIEILWSSEIMVDYISTILQSFIVKGHNSSNVIGINYGEPKSTDGMVWDVDASDPRHQ